MSKKREFWAPTAAEVKALMESEEEFAVRDDAEKVDAVGERLLFAALAVEATRGHDCDLLRLLSERTGAALTLLWEIEGGVNSDPFHVVGPDFNLWDNLKDLAVLKLAVVALVEVDYIRGGIESGRPDKPLLPAGVRPWEPCADFAKAIGNSMRAWSKHHGYRVCEPEAEADGATV